MNYEKQRFQVQTYFWITQWVPKYQENQTGTWSKKSFWRKSYETLFIQGTNYALFCASSVLSVILWTKSEWKSSLHHSLTIIFLLVSLLLLWESLSIAPIIRRSNSIHQVLKFDQSLTGNLKC